MCGRGVLDWNNGNVWPVNAIIDNIKTIAATIIVLSVLSGVGAKVWSMDRQQKENTYWIDEERYDRLEGRIAYKEVDCGEDAKGCDKEEQETVKRWKRRLKKLGKKLGID